MTEYLDRYPTMHEYAEGKRINPKLTDLISRADSIEAVASEITEERSVMNCGLDMAIKIIKALPSADAVQGEWIVKDNELVCSICGNSVSFSRTPKGWVLGKFCQSCGTRMKGGGSE